MSDNIWKPIAEATKTGIDVWLGWRPFRDENGAITSGVIPRLGRYDIGCKKWVSHFEDHGEPEGHRPMPFDPQPDYFCEGYIPPAPTS